MSDRKKTNTKYISNMRASNKEAINKYDERKRAISKFEHQGVTYSKVLVFVSAIIFIFTIIVSFLVQWRITDVFDTAICVTAIGTTGGIFGSCLLWYSKKVASENQYLLRMSMYEDVVNQRLYFNEEMLKLKKKYKVSDETLEEINESGEIDEMMDEALTKVSDKLNEAQEDSESPNELEKFDL